jgi:hypothetical protein
METARVPEPSMSEGVDVGPASHEAAAAVTGIPECDEYLALYSSCESYLEPEIMAGDRRFHRAEQASLVYLAGTPEVAGLPEACRGMLDALRVDCPEQHRTTP